jgi:hypothetical protein
MFKPKRRFHFEACWVKLEGFQEASAEAWQCDQAIMDPIKRLDALFRNTTTSLQSWGQRKIGNIKLHIAIANLVIFKLDVAHERRILSVGKRWLRRTLKHTFLGLASLERTVARQRSRIRWLREGDANTRLFHSVANGRRSMNYVTAVRVGESTITD